MRLAAQCYCVPVSSDVMPHDMSVDSQPPKGSLTGRWLLRCGGLLAVIGVVLGVVIDVLPVDLLAAFHALWPGETQPIYFRVVPTKGLNVFDVVQLGLVALGVVVAAVGWHLTRNGGRQ
jgi:hypothetical protein